MHRTPTIARRAFALITRLLLALVLGAIISTAIAIWAANSDRGRIRWIRTPVTQPADVPAVVPNWSVQIMGYDLFTTADFSPLDPGPDPAAQLEASVALIPDRNLRRLVRPLLTLRSSRLWVYSAGWPLHSLAGYQRSPGTQTPRAAAVNTDTAWRSPWGKWVLVPTRVLWWNLAIDSALFGAPSLLFMLAVTPIRTWRRKRRGLCPSCTYELNHNLAAGCPECGWNRASPKAA